MHLIRKGMGWKVGR